MDYRLFTLGAILLTCMFGCAREPNVVFIYSPYNMPAIAGHSPPVDYPKAGPPKPENRRALNQRENSSEGERSNGDPSGVTTNPLDPPQPQRAVVPDPANVAGGSTQSTTPQVGFPVPNSSPPASPAAPERDWACADKYESGRQALNLYAVEFAENEDNASNLLAPIQDDRLKEAVRDFSMVTNEEVCSTYKNLYTDSLRNLAYAYFFLGDNGQALHQLDYVHQLSSGADWTPSFLHQVLSNCRGTLVGAPLNELRLFYSVDIGALGRRRFINGLCAILIEQ